MSLATIRSLFERELQAAFAALTPPVPVVFDNVEETPPSGEHVVLSLSFPGLTVPVLCPSESGLDHVRGNVQVACYGPKGRGMKRIEELAAVAASTLNSLQSAADPDGVRPRIGSIEGPVPVVGGAAPYMLATISAAFTAKG